MNPFYPLVAERAAHRCEYCHAPEEIFNYVFEVEHLYPEAHGGLTAAANLALACRACNLFKSDFVTGFDDLSQQSIRLFHPRTDRWEDHFEVDLESREILGLTEVGRATVARLRMNQPYSLSARSHWMRLGLFP